MIYQCASQIYIVMDYNFIGQTYIIVYVGAIAIIFLFVIMMVDQRSETNDNGGEGMGIAYLTCGIISLVYINSDSVMIGTIIEGHFLKYSYSNWYTIWQSLPDITIIAGIQYISYPIVLIQQAVSLWAVMIGIISITGNEGNEEKSS